MAGGSGFQPDWTRLGIFLPVNSVDEIIAAGGVITLVRNQYDGVTNSVIRPHVFSGYWKRRRNAKPPWIQDRICWLIVDIPYSLGTPELDTDVELIKLEAYNLYQQNHSPQKSVWVVAHQVYISS